MANIKNLDTTALPNLKPFDLKIKGDVAHIEGEIFKGKILEQALSQLKAKPGFNPAALSIVFGLKW